MSSSQEQLDNLLAYAKANNRICPQPMKWQMLWEQLPDRGRGEADQKLRVPLNIIGHSGFLVGWWASSDSDKAERIEEHIRWAYEHDGLDSADTFLRELSEEDWHHTGE